MVVACFALFARAVLAGSGAEEDWLVASAPPAASHVRDRCWLEYSAHGAPPLCGIEIGKVTDWWPGGS